MKSIIELIIFTCKIYPRKIFWVSLCVIFKLSWYPLRSRLFTHEVGHASREMEIQQKHEDKFKNQHLLFHVLRLIKVFYKSPQP